MIPNHIFSKIDIVIYFDRGVTQQVYVLDEKHSEKLLNNDVIESDRSVPVSQIADNELGENPTVTHDFSVQIDFGKTLPKVISEDTETIKENPATVSITQQKLIQQINMEKVSLYQIDFCA